MICEPDALDENDAGDATAEDQFEREQGRGQMKGHGGCGHEQPVWRKEALKLTAVIKAPPAEKGDVSVHSVTCLTRRSRASLRNESLRQARSTMFSRKSRPKTYTSWV